MQKNVGVRIRVERDLRLDFLEACKRSGRSASEVIRDFMKSYVDNELNGRQPDLFKEKNN